MPYRVRTNPRQIVVSHTARRRAIETRYSVNIESVRDLLYTGPANLLLWGDSISSTQSQPRLPTGIAYRWKPPNGFSGWVIPQAQSAGGSLAKFTPGSTNETNAGGWPFAGLVTTTGTNCTSTGYADSTLFNTTEILTGVVTPVMRSCRKYVWSGATTAQIFNNIYCGVQGQSQMGSVWAGGDWITQSGTSTLRAGILHLSNSATLTTAGTYLSFIEGALSDGGAGTSADRAVTLTASATPAAKIDWLDPITLASCDTPFGGTTNNCGNTKVPFTFQYGGIGSVSPGTVMDSSQIVAAGNADWAGAWRMTTQWFAGSANLSAFNFIHYGTVLERTDRTTGLYVDNISFSGDTIRTQVDSSTVAQMAATLNTNTARPINWVLMQIGENHTAAEWNGGSINATQIRTDLLARIQRVNDGWAAAGLPRGLITLVSPWETVGGTKSGSAWYTTVADIYRDIARGDPNVSFIDLRQMMADRYTADQMYNASRNAWMNILYDGVHPSWIGCRINAELLQEAILGSINE